MLVMQELEMMEQQAHELKDSRLFLEKNTVNHSNVEKAMQMGVGTPP